MGECLDGGCVGVMRGGYLEGVEMWGGEWVRLRRGSLGCKKGWIGWKLGS